MVTVKNLIWEGFIIRDIYGTNSVQIPEGYEYCGFYPPDEGEKFIIAPSNYLVEDRKFSVGIKEPSEYITTPRIIVEKTEDYMLPYKKCFIITWTIKDIYGVEDPVIPEGYEVEEFRLVEKGEEYLVQSGCKDLWDIFPPSAKPFIVLRKKKKRFYVKIPLVSFVKEETSIYIQFQNVEGRPVKVDMPKDIEIIEE